MTIALTGGIASGKSLVADKLAAMGAVIIDADVVARAVVEPGTPGLARIVERFGSSIVLADGTLDRAKLSGIVFADDAARADLNAIVHPLVRARAQELEDAAPEGSVVVHVIPLLVETGLDKQFDHIIVVDASDEVRLARLMNRDRLSRDQALARIKAQASRENRLRVADWVIDNGDSPDSAAYQAGELWRVLTGRQPNWSSNAAANS